MYLEDIRAEHKYDNEDLFKQLSETEDPILQDDIRGKIALNNMAFVHYILDRNYSYVNDARGNKYNITKDDLFGVSMEGLLKAIDTFDMTKGFKFATYSYRVISNELGMFMRKYNKSGEDQSLYRSIATDEEGEDIQLVDVIEEIEEGYVGFEDSELSSIIIREAKEILSEREYKVLKLVCSGVKQIHIAEYLDAPQPTVSRINIRARTKLRDFYNKKGIDADVMG